MSRDKFFLYKSRDGNLAADFESIEWACNVSFLVDLN